MTSQQLSDDDDEEWGGVSLFPDGGQISGNADDNADDLRSGGASKCSAGFPAYDDAAEDADDDGSAWKTIPKSRARSRVASAAAARSDRERQPSTRDGSVTPPAKPWDFIAEPNRYRSAHDSSYAGSARYGTGLQRPAAGTPSGSRIGRSSRAETQPPANRRRFAKARAYKKDEVSFLTIVDHQAYNRFQPAASITKVEKEKYTETTYAPDSDGEEDSDEEWVRARNRQLH